MTLRGKQEDGTRNAKHGNGSTKEDRKAYTDRAPENPNGGEKMTDVTPETQLTEDDRSWVTRNNDLHWQLVEVLHRFRREHDGTWDNVHAHASMVERLVRSHPAPEPYRPSVRERIVWRIRVALGWDAIV